MNEQYFAERVRQHLNRSLQDIGPEPLARLRAARAEALRRQKAPATSPVLAGVGHFFQFHTERLHLRHLLAIMSLALAAAFYAHWQAEQVVADLEETDSALLTGDAPVEVFADKGFAAWLKESSER